MTRWMAGFATGVAAGMVCGAWVGALLTAAAIETIGRAVELPGKVRVPDEVPEAWSVTW
jgi:hypothetical protein